MDYSDLGQYLIDNNRVIIIRWPLLLKIAKLVADFSSLCLIGDVQSAYLVVLVLGVVCRRHQPQR